MSYIKFDKNQGWLLHPNVKDLIPKDHICFLVEYFEDEKGKDVDWKNKKRK